MRAARPGSEVPHRHWGGPARGRPAVARPAHARVHEADRGAIRLGEDTTDAEGRYTIRYEPLPGVDGINLRHSALGEDG